MSRFCVDGTRKSDWLAIVFSIPNEAKKNIGLKAALINFNLLFSSRALIQTIPVGEGCGSLCLVSSSRRLNGFFLSVIQKENKSQGKNSRSTMSTYHIDRKGVI